MTESPLANPGTVKLAAVAVGAYVLGRMKKGRAAVSLAMWATGTRMDPKQLLRQGLVNLATSDDGKQLLAQLRGPVMEAGKRAATATLEGQVTALTRALEQRTDALNAVGDQAGQRAGKAAHYAGDEAGSRTAALSRGEGRVTGLVGRRRKRRQDEGEEDTAGARAEEEEPEEEPPGEQDRV